MIEDIIEEIFSPSMEIITAMYWPEWVFNILIN